MGRCRERLDLGCCRLEAYPVFTTLVSSVVSGTHDIPELKRVLAELAEGKMSEVKAPVFDKSSDDRSPESRVLKVGFHSSRV